MSDATRAVPVAITPADIVGGHDDVLLALCEMRGRAVFAYCRRVAGRGLAVEACADAFGSFRQSVIDAPDREELDIEATLLDATRHAAAQRAPRVAANPRLPDVRPDSPACAKAPLEIAARWTGELPRAAGERLQRHLEQCASCQAAEERALAAEGAYRHPPSEGLASGIRLRVIAALRAASADEADEADDAAGAADRQAEQRAAGEAAERAEREAAARAAGEAADRAAGDAAQRYARDVAIAADVAAALAAVRRAEALAARKAASAAAATAARDAAAEAQARAVGEAQAAREALTAARRAAASAQAQAAHRPDSPAGRPPSTSAPDLPDLPRLPLAPRFPMPGPPAPGAPSSTAAPSGRPGHHEPGPAHRGAGTESIRRQFARYLDAVRRDVRRLAARRRAARRRGAGPLSALWADGPRTAMPRRSALIALAVALVVVGALAQGALRGGEPANESGAGAAPAREPIPAAPRQDIGRDPAPVSGASAADPPRSSARAPARRAAGVVRPANAPAPGPTETDGRGAAPSP